MINYQLFGEVVMVLGVFYFSIVSILIIHYILNVRFKTK